MSYPHPAQQEFYSQAGSSDVGAFPSSSSGASAAKSDGITTQLTTDYPTIANLSREDLEALADGRGDPESEAYFEALIDTLPQVRALYDEHEALLRRNEELATQNTSLQGQLETLRADTLESFTRARGLQDEWAAVDAAQREAYKRFHPSALHALLTQSISKVHDQSESLASAFVEGLPLDVAGLSRGESGTHTSTNAADDDTAFVRRYREIRTLYHRRNLVAERWARGKVTWQTDW